MCAIYYEGFLTQQKLHNILTQCFSKVETEVRILHGLRTDFVIDDKFVIEFDGESHFRDPNVIQRDEIKDTYWNLKNIETIRIPYFLQINKSTINSFFSPYIDSKIEISTNFKHGFIDKKAHLPASFCPIGYAKFKVYIDYFLKNNTSVIYDIYDSLIQKSHNTKYVFYDDYIQNKIQEVIKPELYLNCLQKLDSYEIFYELEPLVIELLCFKYGVINDYSEELIYNFGMEHINHELIISEIKSTSILTNDQKDYILLRIS